MPVINKKPFIKQKPPNDLKPNEEVFYCEPTDEVFRNYNDFFERMILCNSLLWSCEISGKSGLTYSEAVNHERGLHESVDAVDAKLRRAVIYLASLTVMTSLKQLTTEIYHYSRYKYFKGEFVFTLVDNIWKECEIVSISEKSPKVNGNSSDAYENCAENDDSDRSSYSVRLVHTDQPSYIEDVLLSRLTRQKGRYSRDLVHHLLRIHLRADEVTGVFKVQPHSRKLYGIDRLTFADIYVGVPPTFSVTRFAKSAATTNGSHAAGGAHGKQNSRSHSASVANSAVTSRDSRNMSMKAKQNLEEERRSILAQRLLERDRRKERKKVMDYWIKDWCRIRDDLLCEDHKPLPAFEPVECRLSNDLLGACFQLMQFLVAFDQFLSLADSKFFATSATLTVPLIERVLLDNEIVGPLPDLLALLLRSVIELHNDECTRAGYTEPYDSEVYISKCSTDFLDSFTITEMLRRHFRDAFPAKDESLKRWRIQNRGGYIDSDCATSDLKWKRPEIVELISSKNVLYLKPDKRVALIECLMVEMLTSVKIRNHLDGVEANLRELRSQLRVTRALAITSKKEIERYDAELKHMQQNSSNSGPSSDPSATAALTALESRLHTLRTERHLCVERVTALCEQVLTAHTQCVLTPLGSDRCGRHYWLLPSVPALLVETPGGWQPPCNSQPSRVCDALCCARDGGGARGAGEAGVQFGAAVAECNMGAWAESEEAQEARVRRVLAAHVQARYLLPDTPLEGALEELLGTCEHLDVREELETATRGRVYTVSDDVNMRLCAAHPGRCAAHTRTGGPPGSVCSQWAYVSDCAVLAQLLDSLNPRGVRESELRANILSVMEGVYRVVDSTPAADLSLQLRTSGDRRGARKHNSLAEANLNFASDTDVSHIENLVVRDEILMFEEKCRLGAIGYLNVDNIESYRTAIVNKQYEMGCDRLEWGTKFRYSNSDKLDFSKMSEHDAEVKKMALAILQLEQCIERKYLIKPLGTENLIGRWENVLMGSTSISQLFIALKQLDHSVLWKKSILHTKCKICLRKCDSDKMLLCDTCNKGFHMYCLRPRLKRVPKGDWYCTQCKPIEIQTLAESDTDSVESEQPSVKPARSSVRAGKRARMAASLSPPPVRSVSQRRASLNLRTKINTNILFQTIKALQNHPSATMFMCPVDEKQVPDYYQIISQPMDLSTIHQRLTDGYYHSNDQLIDDVDLIFINCNTYNEKNSYVHSQCQKLKKYFEKKCSQLGLYRS